MKVNGIHESSFVAESACTDLDGFDPAVDPFSRAIAGLQNDGIENSPQMVPDCPGSFFHRFKPAAHSPAQPFRPISECPAPGFIVP